MAFPLWLHVRFQVHGGPIDRVCGDRVDSRGTGFILEGGAVRRHGSLEVRSRVKACGSGLASITNSRVAIVRPHKFADCGNVLCQAIIENRIEGDILPSQVVGGVTYEIQGSDI